MRDRDARVTTSWVTAPESTAGESITVRARLYSVSWRLVASCLVALSGVSLPAILLLVLVARDPPVTPPVLFRLVLLFTIAPGALALLATWAARAIVQCGPGAIVIHRGRLRLEIPGAAVVGVVPWKLPLPGSGLSLRTRAGGRYGLQLRDPTPLARALADRAGVAAARIAIDHPALVYARAKQSVAPPPRWYHRLGKFVLFGLFPTAVLFNAHQHIAYGGLWGEWYLMGPASYLTTFAVYWGTLIVYLVLYASVWRGSAEGLALLAAWAAPSRAARVRRLAEGACRIAFYGGVPVLLLVRFLPW